MKSRSGFTWIELCVVLAILAVLLALVGAPFAIEFVFYAFVYGLFGWYWFLVRALPEVEWYGPGLVLGLLGLLLFANGLHVVLQRWLKHADGDGDRLIAFVWSWWKTGGVVAGLGLLFVSGTSIVGAVHEVLWCARAQGRLIEIDSGSARSRMESMNNLKQIVLAAHNIAAAGEGELPPGGRFDAEGRQLHGWMTEILPAMDQAALYRAINRDLPWRTPANREYYSLLIRAYLNPKLAREGQERTSDGYALAQYSGNSWIFGSSTGYSLEEIPDGTSQTLLMGEINANFRAWGDAANWRDPGLGLDTSPEGFGSPFRDTVNFAFADGAVRSLNKKIDPDVLSALATPAGGEQVDPRDY